MIKSIRATLGLRPDGGASGPGETGTWRRQKGSAKPILDGEAQWIADNATPECVLDRARHLRSVSRVSEAYALQRRAWRLGRSRREMISLAQQASREDEHLANLVVEADAARDTGQWAEAEILYRRALDLYEPLAGYRVQFAHMLKEQGRFDRAEVNYRDAMAWQAPECDVLPHLDFVCRQQGLGRTRTIAPHTTAGPMAEAPTVVDIESLAYAIWREASLSSDDLLIFLRECPTGDAVAARMIADDRFVFRNGPLLQLLSARS